MSSLAHSLSKISCLLLLCGPILSWTTTSRADSISLLRNPELSEGMLHPRGWDLNATESNLATWQVDATGTLYSVLLQGCGRDWAGLSSNTIPVQAGEILYVSAWLQRTSPQPTDGRDALFCRFFRRGTFLQQSGPSLETLGASWERVQGTVVVPKECDQVDVSIQVWSKASVRVFALSLVRADRDRDETHLFLPCPPSGKANWSPVTEPQNLPEDRNRNGLADSLEKVLGILAKDQAQSVRLSRKKTTSFQTSTGYREDNDIKTDIVIIADNQELKIKSWKAMGYEPHVMVGFRAGPDYLEGDGTRPARWDEVQQDREGRYLTCGPNSFYMVPTENRRRIFQQYFREASQRGARAACPEEPEYFGRAGYSQAFRKEWQDFFGDIWEDPTSSVHARHRTARLMTELQTRLLEACWHGAREIDPGIRRFLLTHTPLNYAHWGIVFGHHHVLDRGHVDAMVAQVWTGTARTPVRYAGQTSERTFENACLEYASALGLVRGLDVELWFLMDPLEDHPDRTMEDYRSNYQRTVVAALMFPEVIHYETMPWPTRIYGRVPDSFATEIGIVVQVLSHMQRFAEHEIISSSPTVGVFLGDTALWQRNDPHESSMDSFYGLTLPLVMKGIPVAVPHLDRVPDPGYLIDYKLLLLSYDFVKPQSVEVNEELAQWVQDGGILILFGGDSPYNEVESWWKDAGWAAPQDDLLTRCGWNTEGKRTTRGLPDPEDWTVVAESTYKGRDLGNRTLERIDLSPFLSDGTVLVKCQDSDPSDGWGAFLSMISIQGFMDGTRVQRQIIPNSPQEKEFILLDRETGQHAQSRFCDGRSFIVYRFQFDPGTRAEVVLDLGNEYRISVLPGQIPVSRSFSATSEKFWGKTVSWPATEPLVTYENSGGHPLYEGDSNLVTEKAHGKGWVLFCAGPSACFAQSEAGAERLRSLVRYAWTEKLKAPWRESSSFMVERGPYVAIKTLEEGLSLSGPFLDLFHPELPVLDECKMGNDSVALLMRLPTERPLFPSILFTSSCLEWSDEKEDCIRLIVSGPAETEGCLRIDLGKASLKAIRSWNVVGETETVRSVLDQGLLLLQYPNEPHGLAMELKFKEG